MITEAGKAGTRRLPNALPLYKHPQSQGKIKSKDQTLMRRPRHTISSSTMRVPRARKPRPAKKKFPLLKLPTEVRRMIYALVFAQDEQGEAMVDIGFLDMYDTTAYAQLSKNHLLGIAATSSQIYYEMLEPIYNFATFTFDLSKLDPDQGPSRAIQRSAFVFDIFQIRRWQMRYVDGFAASKALRDFLEVIDHARGVKSLELCFGAAAARENEIDLLRYRRATSFSKTWLEHNRAREARLVYADAYTNSDIEIESRTMSPVFEIGLTLLDLEKERRKRYLGSGKEDSITTWA